MSSVLIDEPAAVAHLNIGTEVEVRRRFDGAWARGFEICGHTDTGYRLRRHSDGAVLPVPFPPDDIRVAQLLGS